MKKLEVVILWSAVLLCLAAALLLCEPHLLWKIQSMNLFLFNEPFFCERMLVPAGMLSYAGTFFTSLLFHPWLGVGILCAWWWLVMWLTQRVFRIPRQWVVLTVVPVALMTVMLVSLGYWVYLLKLQGWLFIPPIGLSMALASLWVFRLLYMRRWKVSLAWAVLTLLLGYPLAGAYALFAALVMAVWVWRLGTDRWRNVAVTLTAVVAAVAIPLLCYRYVYYQTSLTDLWSAGLPVFCLTESTPEYYIPYVLLALFYVLLACRPKLPLGRQMGRWLRGRWMQVSVLVGLVVAIWLCWFKDENFHHELRMAHCVERTDWMGVLEEGMKQHDEPTRSIVMMNNLALWRIGRQCEDMYSFPKGSKKPASAIPIYMFNVAGRMIYYQYGLLNECHRMCMEEGVELGWRTEHLQYLARCAVMGGEKQVARKYLNLLRQTPFYGPWADNMEQLLDHPELMAETRETGPITHMLHYDDNLGADNGYVERYLMTLLARQETDDPIMQEQALIGALWTREPSLFWPQFIKYAQLHPDNPLPRIYQEAAILFGSMQRLDIVNRIPFDPQVRTSFEGFMRELNGSKGMSAEELRSMLYPKYGNTYYFEYFFLKDITYY